MICSIANYEIDSNNLYCYNYFTMKFQNTKRNRIRLALLLLPLVAGLVFLLFRNQIFDFAVSHLPKCPFNKVGILCPGCGNTRALAALAGGHLIESIFYNPTLFIGGVFILLIYIEQIGLLFGKRIKLIPRKWWFYVILAVLLTAYFIMRNIDGFRWLTWIKPGQ